MTQPTPIRGIIEEQLKYTCPHTPTKEAGECKLCRSRIDQTLQAIDNYYKKYYGKKVRGAMPEQCEKIENDNGFVIMERVGFNLYHDKVHRALDKLFGIGGKRK